MKPKNREHVYRVVEGEPVIVLTEGIHEVGSLESLFDHWAKMGYPYVRIECRTDGKVALTAHQSCEDKEAGDEG